VQLAFFLPPWGLKKALISCTTNKIYAFKTHCTINTEKI
jgi:hypothetical protein